MLKCEFTNIINLDNFDTFGMIFEEAWKEPELFASLVDEKVIPVKELKSVSAWTSLYFKI